MLPFGQMWRSCPRCFHKPTSISLSSWHALIFRRTARLRCCALWVPKGRILMLLPVYGSQSSSSLAMAALKDVVLSKQRLPHWVVDTISHAFGASGRPLPSGLRCHSTRSISTSWMGSGDINPKKPGECARRRPRCRGDHLLMSPLPILWAWSFCRAPLLPVVSKGLDSS